MEVTNSPARSGAVIAQPPVKTGLPVPADDYTDPAPATTFAHIDATITLQRASSRKLHKPLGNSATKYARL